MVSFDSSYPALVYDLSSGYISIVCDMRCCCQLKMAKPENCVYRWARCDPEKTLLWEPTLDSLARDPERTVQVRLLVQRTAVGEINECG